MRTVAMTLLISLACASFAFSQTTSVRMSEAIARAIAVTRDDVRHQQTGVSEAEARAGQKKYDGAVKIWIGYPTFLAGLAVATTGFCSSPSSSPHCRAGRTDRQKIVGGAAAIAGAMVAVVGTLQNHAGSRELAAFAKPVSIRPPRSPWQSQYDRLVAAREDSRATIVIGYSLLGFGGLGSMAYFAGRGQFNVPLIAMALGGAVVGHTGRMHYRAAYDKVLQFLSRGMVW